MIKTALVLALTAITAHAELPTKFVRAIHLTETSGRVGYIVGDNGKALGPLQIHRNCWKDSGVNGAYTNVVSLPYASKVMSAYLTRYCPKAVSKGDYETMARVWNGGPMGHKSKSTVDYWKKVKNNLN
jgi:hypothetical protein